MTVYINLKLTLLQSFQYNDLRKLEVNIHQLLPQMITGRMCTQSYCTLCTVILHGGAGTQQPSCPLLIKIYLCTQLPPIHDLSVHCCTYGCTHGCTPPPFYPTSPRCCWVSGSMQFLNNGIP